MSRLAWSGGKLVVFGAAVVAACVTVSSSVRAISPDAAEVQLQLARLLFADGRYAEAQDAFDAVKTSEYPRVRREALMGASSTALRMADFSVAYTDARDLIKVAGRDVDAIALYGDALWGVGQFENAEKEFQQGITLQPGHARSLHGMARSLATRNKLNEAIDAVQAAIKASPRDAELHHTAGTIYAKLHRYEEAADAFSSYINLLPNKDRSANAAWSRSYVKFLRAFGKRMPLELDSSSVGKLHTVPFKVVDEKVIVRGRVNGGRMMDFVLDTGAEQTVISRETAARQGIRPIVNILSAGVGDLGVRGLELTRLDSLEIGSLKVRNVPAIIKNPPLHGLPTREMESFSPLSLGLSVVIDYDKGELVIGTDLPSEASDVQLPLRLSRLAMVSGQVDGGPASFILDTGGQVISISTDMASVLDRAEAKQIPLKVYGASGWDRDAFLMPGVDLAFSPQILYKNYSVVVLNLRAPSVLLGFRLGGIVGYKFLSRYRVAIDLARSVVTLKNRSGQGPIAR